MKKILSKAIVAAMLTAVFAGCKYEDPTAYVDDPAIYFKGVFANEEDRKNVENEIPDATAFSFLDVIAPSGEYVLEVYVQTQGIPGTVDRKFSVRQKDVEPSDPTIAKAVAGTDYVAFASEYTMPAGEVMAAVPITFLMHHELLYESRELVLELVAGNDFRLGMNTMLTYKVQFSSMPEKPSNWDTRWGAYHFGMSWGPVKHQFIIQTCGIIDWPNWDGNLGGYYAGKCKFALIEYNAANPGNELCEFNADGTRGAEVTFDS